MVNYICDMVTINEIRGFDDARREIENSAQASKTMDVLLEINIAWQESKSGFFRIGKCIRLRKASRVSASVAPGAHDDRRPGAAEEERRPILPKCANY
jgi:uncharacterized pyridoxal phosphate-containing UPF0001 family protein